MKKFIYIIVVGVIINGILVACYNSAIKQEYHKISGETQGTTYHITYKYNNNKDLQPEIENILHEFDLTFSNYIPNSIISRINRNEEGVKVDENFKELFNRSIEIYQESDGAFDLTVAPLVNAWGFGFMPGSEIDSALIDSLLQFTGMQNIDLKNNEIIKSSPEVMLDVNAIAQGYSVDIVCRFLEGKNIKDYIVEIGGELRALGKNAKGQKWRVGIDSPFDGNNVSGTNLQAIIELSGKSMATSGNYRKFYEKNGVKYAHTIDPKTGYPVVSRLLSATVIAPNCMSADGYATVLMVFGLEKSIEFLKSHTELDAYLVYSNLEGKYDIYATGGMKPLIIEEALN